MTPEFSTDTRTRTVYKKRKRNTVDDMVKAAVIVTDEAVTLAEELLDKWLAAERHSINAASWKHGEMDEGCLAAQRSLDKKYEEYKSRLFKMRER